MRILLINTTFDARDDFAHRLLILADDLRRRGMEVGLASCAKSAENSAIPPGVAHFPLPGIAGARLVFRHRAMQRAVGGILESFKPDIAQVGCLDGLTLEPILAPREAGVPVIAMLRDYAALCGNRRLLRNRLVLSPRVCSGPRPATCAVCGAMSARALRPRSWARAPVESLAGAASPVRGAALRSCSAVVAVSRNIARRAALFSPEVIALPGTPGLENEHPALHRNARLFVTGGQMVEESGLDLAIGAFTLLPQYRLVVAGDGPQRGRLVRMARDLSNVVVCRASFPRDRLLRVIGQARAVIVPSKWEEGCPGLAVDALVRGTPVVVSDLGSLRELAPTPRHGRVFHPGSVDALHRAVLEIRRQIPLRFDSSRYRLESVGEAYATLYQRVAAGVSHATAAIT